MDRNVLQTLWAGLLMCVPLTADAQESLHKPIPLEAWRTLVLGHTVTYYRNGVFRALEYYDPNGVTVVYQSANATCMTGQWRYHNGLAPYCFDWPDGTSCFQHIRVGDDIEIRSAPTSTNPNVSHVHAIEPVPLTCNAFESS